MKDEEEFFLGESELDTDFFLGDDQEEVYLGDSSSHENIQIETEKKDSSFTELLEIFELLKIREKPFNTEFFEYFKDNPEIFKVANTDYFKILTPEEIKNFEEKCNRLIGVSHKAFLKKIITHNEQEDFQKAINALRMIFNQPAKTEEYIAEIKRTLRNQLGAALKQKIKDRILEVSEIQELMEIAVSIHLIPDTKEGRNSILSNIKKLNEKNLFKIESFEETFIRIVASKEKIHRMDTNTVRSILFKEYKALYDISNNVLSQKQKCDDTEIFEDMCQLLADKDLLVSNIDLFMVDFLESEIQKKGSFYFEVPLNNDYYYYLKGTAINKYELSEDQWRQITMIRNIRNESDFTVAFIMGYKKESSVIGIANLIQDNPEMACSRILAGDLETFFSHIGRNNIANKISKLKEAYKSNNEELITGVVNLLKNEISDISVNVLNETREEKTLDKLISKEASIKELLSYFIENKSDESLYNELIKESSIKERISALLFSNSKKISYTKFLANLLNELLLEPDISQYKIAFIKIALCLQQLLIENDDFITYINVFALLITKAISNRVLDCPDEIENYSNTFGKMKKKYDDEQILAAQKSKKKTMFTLFRKGE